MFNIITKITIIVFNLIINLVTEKLNNYKVAYTLYTSFIPCFLGQSRVYTILKDVQVRAANRTKILINNCTCKMLGLINF